MFYHARITFKWDFGDDNVSHDQNPIYKYTSKGIYTVIFNVTDYDGDCNTMAKSIIVNDNKEEERIPELLIPGYNLIFLFVFFSLIILYYFIILYSKKDKIKSKILI